MGASNQKLGEWNHSYGSQATRKKVYAGKCTNYFKQIGVAEFALEAISQLQEGDEILVTGETTGAYEQTVHNLHDEAGNPTNCVKQGTLFALKTDKVLRRGDKLFKLEVQP